MTEETIPALRTTVMSMNDGVQLVDNILLIPVRTARTAPTRAKRRQEMADALLAQVDRLISGEISEISLSLDTL